jgi:hypothetical protein
MQGREAEAGALAANERCPPGGLEDAAAAIIDEVRPPGHLLLVGLLDESALLRLTRLGHQIGRGAGPVRRPGLGAVGAARGLDAPPWTASPVSEES